MAALSTVGRVTGWTCMAIGAVQLVGGVGRLATRATVGRPHGFHDLLLAVELAAPLVVEALARRDRPPR